MENARNIRLTPDEKADMKRTVLSFMEANPAIAAPVREPERQRPLLQRSLINLIQLINFKPMPIIIAIVLMLTAGGGVSYAAENSLPGDILYPVKVSINEPVREALTFSTEAKAKLGADLAERRLDEMEKLSIKTDVKAETKAEIEKNFQDQINKMKDLLTRLENEKNVDAATGISSDFEAALKAHSKILERLASTEKDDEQEIKGLNESVKQGAKDAEESRSRFEIGFSGEANEKVMEGAKNRLESAADRIKDTKESLNDKRSKMGAEAVAQVETQIKLADTTLIQAQAKFDAKSYGEAFTLAQQAERTARETKRLIEAKDELNIDVQIKDGEDDDDDEPRKVEDQEKDDEESESDKEDENDSKDMPDIKPIIREGAGLNINAKVEVERD